jgi:hypothetical protein
LSEATALDIVPRAIDTDDDFDRTGITMSDSTTNSTGRSGMWRSRWAAIGAAVAVTFGAGGLIGATAASPESSTVSIAPVRILDTRDPQNVGLVGPFASTVSQDLKVTGPVAVAGGGTATVVPAGASGVYLNVTPVNSTAGGFISVRPANATGVPSTSNVNFTVGDINPNAVLVEVPVGGTDDGKTEITYNAFEVLGPTTDILVDVVGYTTDARLKAIEATVAASSSGFFHTALSVRDWTGVPQTVISVPLPAGKFVVTATVVADNNAGGQRSVNCNLRLGATVIASLFGFLVLAPSGQSGESQTIALTGAGELAVAGDANLFCNGFILEGDWRSPSITAIQVASLTGGVSSSLVEAESEE